MTRRILLCTLLVQTLIMASSCGESPKEPLVRQIPTMSTVAELKLWAPEDQAEKAADAARDAILEVETLCNIFNPSSELSKLNASAFDSPFKCSPQLWDILSDARRFHKISGGSFDITVKPLMSLWGFHRKRGTLPSQSEIDEAMKCVGLDKVAFDDDAHTVSFKVKGAGLDLGGIAKGWAVDKAAESVIALGVRSGIINLGGNMRCLPLPPPGRKYYSVAVRDPFSKESLCATVRTLNASLATSGDYERYVIINGRHFTHIMDPRTGHPVENVLSATILTPLSMEADALSTSIFINGAPFAKEICARMPATSVLLVRRDPADTSRILIERFDPADWGEISLSKTPER